jgi:hypothetical protein
MSTNKDLFKEAIADAKQVREAALANAKAALEEALTPKLQSMISARLQEMDLDEEEVDEIDFMKPSDTSDEQQETGYGNIEQGNAGRGDVNEEDLEEDFDLSAILAELGDEEDSLHETKEEDEEKEKMKEAKEEEPEEAAEEESGEAEEEMPSEEATDEEKITDLTVDQLKDIIKDIISAELEAEEYETPEEEAGEENGEEMNMDMGNLGGEEEEVNLEELLAELDALDEVEETESLNESAIADILTTLAGVSGIGLTGIAVTKAQDLLKQKNPELYAKLQSIGAAIGKAKGLEEAEEEKDEMKEAIDTIEALRAELHEQNLLNAKLLYVNKIFKAKNLTESQKLKVIASFDKATTPAQAKELFESIQGSDFGASKKSQIKESLGFASKAAGVAPKNSANTIVESNDVIARMQKLANIIK